MITGCVSIIIPVFQSESHLRRCIDSVLGQTYGDFELILIDDGRAGRCGSVCGEYARKDSRIVVIHEETGSLASARNAGLQHAAGEYIAFIDPDDWVHPQYLEVLLTVLKKTGALFSACGFERVRTYFMGNPVAADKAVVVLLDKAGIAAFQHIRTCLWGKLFRAESLCGVRFSGDEDALTMAALESSPLIRAAFTPLALYYAFVR